MKKQSSIIIVFTLVVVFSLIVSPAISQSVNPCSLCHGAQGYSQTLNILEENPTNQIPTSLSVGQKANVSVVIENKVNTQVYTALSPVMLMLSSEKGYFAVDSPTFTIGKLPSGKATATWQITALTAGTDSIVIKATATNPHQGTFANEYSPMPTITISSPTPTPGTTDPTKSRSSTTTPSPTEENSTQILDSANNYNILRVWFSQPTENGKLTPDVRNTIVWNTSGGEGSLNGKLELSKTGIGGPWIVLAENLKNVNSFDWTVPSNEAVNSYIRLTVTDSSQTPQSASNVILVHNEETILNPSSFLLMFLALPFISLGAFMLVRKRKHQQINFSLSARIKIQN